MQDNRVAKRYASALFSTARELDVVQNVEDELSSIVDILHADSGFGAFLLSPYASREEKLRLAEKLFADRVTALTMHLLRLVLAKRREAEIERIRDAFVVLRQGHEEAVALTVLSAEPLPQDQRDRLVSTAAKVAGRAVEPTFVVEPSLLGGVKLEYENVVLDGTVRGNLAKLREKLRYDLFKNA